MSDNDTKENLVARGDIDGVRGWRKLERNIGEEYLILEAVSLVRRYIKFLKFKIFADFAPTPGRSSTGVIPRLFRKLIASQQGIFFLSLSLKCLRCVTDTTALEYRR